MLNNTTNNKKYYDIIFDSNLHWLKLDLKIDISKIWEEIKSFENYGEQS